MKHINKFLTGALLLGLTVATCHAQSYPEARHYSFSFLPSGITAVYVTNTLALTNLNTAGTAGTNVAGLVYTNSGTQVVVGSGDYQPLLNDVNLWIPRDGRNWTPAQTNGLIDFHVVDVPATLSMTYSSGSGANAAVTFVCVPMIDDTREVNANPWTFSFTAVASQTGTTVSTNAYKLWEWPGAKKIRIRRIVNADTDASSQVVITALQLNGYK